MKYLDTKENSLENSVLRVWQEAAKKMDEKKLDAVNPKAVKKKFDDRKDKDIDNDGDPDIYVCNDFWRMLEPIWEPTSANNNFKIDVEIGGDMGRRFWEPKVKKPDWPAAEAGLGY